MDSILLTARSRDYAVASGGHPPEPLWRYLLPDLDHPVVQTRSSVSEPGAVEIVQGSIDPADLGSRNALYLPGSGAPRTGFARIDARVRRVVGRFWRRVSGRSTSHVTVADRPGIDLTVASPKTAVTMVAPPDVALTPLPTYLHRILAEHGFAASRTDVRVIPPRGYRQQKIIFLTTRPDGSAGLALKMTQHESANARLMTEHTGLLEVIRIIDVDSVPTPHFGVTHQGLVVVGQDAVAGTPFSQRSDGSIDDDQIAALLRWARRLGERSATIVEGSDLAGALHDLVDRFHDVYGELGTGQRLREDLQLFGDRSEVPVVFGHGDLGFWNVIVQGDGTQVVCDWENAESMAPPLWDAFYCAQTYAAWAGERSGHRFTTQRFQSQLLDPASEWCGWLWGHLQDQADAVGVDRELILPLVRTWLAFAALKESTRLSPQKLQQGRSVNMLRCMAALRQPPA